VVVSTSDREGRERLLGDPLLKVSVLGTRPIEAFRSPLASPLPLLRRERDVPKSRRHGLAAIEKALESVGI
jgi:hypothetical protein